ncbi:MAG: PKD domain-containing protein, partial [Planctomycetota bacterium]
TYAVEGTYEAVVWARGDGGAGRAAKGGVTVHARPFQIASAEGKRDRAVDGSRNPLAYVFSASAEHGTGPCSYSWDFGDGGTSSEASGGHVFAAPGRRKVKLTVTDSGAPARTVTKEIDVDVLPYSLTLRADHYGGETPAKVTFRAQLFGVGGGEVAPDEYHFSWDLSGPKTAEGRGLAEVSDRFDLVGFAPLPPGAAPAPEPLDATLPPGKRYVELPVLVKAKAPDGTVVGDKVTINLRPPEEHFPGRAALLSAVGGMLLIGGLVLCVLVAFKHHRKSPPGFNEEALG